MQQINGETRGQLAKRNPPPTHVRRGKGDTANDGRLPAAVSSVRGGSEIAIYGG